MQGISSNASYDYGGGASLFFYGEKPTFAKTNLASDAPIGQAVINVTDEVDWANGDSVVIGKENIKGQGVMTVHTVSSVSGTQITLTSNLLTNLRRSGGTVLRLGGYGVKLEHPTSTSLWYPFTPANLIFEGVEIYNVYMTTSGTSLYYYQSAINTANRSQHLFRDCLAWTNGNTATYVITSLIPPDGTLMERLYGFRVNMATGCVAYYLNYHKSGRMVIRNCVCMSQYAGTISTATNIRLTLENNSFENARASVPFFYMTGINSIFKNNKIWGSATVEGSGGAVTVAQCVSPLEISGNSYDFNVVGVVFGAYTNVDCYDTDSTFGSEYANTTDIGFIIDANPDYTFYSPSGDLTISQTYIPDMVVGGKVAFVDFNDVPTDDRVIFALGRTQRTGDGLSDNTVHTPGVGKFALRIEPTSSSETIIWSFDVPTGNIQGQPITVSLYIKINTTNYYAGDNIMPFLAVTYDVGETSSSVTTETTDWQKLAVTVTPETASSKITVAVGGATDAVGSDAYFYIDDVSVSYPAGAQLNLGGLDIWDNALYLLLHQYELPFHKKLKG